VFLDLARPQGELILTLLSLLFFQQGSFLQLCLTALDSFSHLLLSLQSFFLLDSSGFSKLLFSLLGFLIL